MAYFYIIAFVIFIVWLYFHARNTPNEDWVDD